MAFKKLNIKMTIKIPPMKGLLYALKTKQAQATQYARSSRSQTKCPRSAHDDAVSAEKCAVEAKTIEGMIAEDSEWIGTLDELLRKIAASKAETLNRQLAVHHLELAELYLRKDLGDSPIEKA